MYLLPEFSRTLGSIKEIQFILFLVLFEMSIWSRLHAMLSENSLKRISDNKFMLSLQMFISINQSGMYEKKPEIMKISGPSAFQP